MNDHSQWHASAMQEAMDQALWQIDEHALNAPRACSYAVSKLIGDRCWGAGLFDQSPLVRVYLDSVRRVAALGVGDPGRELDELLDGCVAKAKLNEHPAFVHSVNGVNPVEFLAGLLGAAVGDYLATYAEIYAGEVEDAALRQAYEKAYPGETVVVARGQGHADEPN